MARVWVYNRFEFASLMPNFVQDKKIIRFHNFKDKGWYPQQEDNALVFFFDDVGFSQLTWIERIKSSFLTNQPFCTKDDIEKIKDFVAKHRDDDFIVHCEYGKSRSVAFAVFLKEKYGYQIMNKKEEELKCANNWMLYLFER